MTDTVRDDEARGGDDEARGGDAVVARIRDGDPPGPGDADERAAAFAREVLARLA